MNLTPTTAMGTHGRGVTNRYHIQTAGGMQEVRVTPARGTSRDDDSARCVFESRVQACGYDTARNDNGRYRWAAVRDMWRGWQLAAHCDPANLK